MSKTSSWRDWTTRLGARLYLIVLGACVIFTTFLSGLAYATPEDCSKIGDPVQKRVCEGLTQGGPGGHMPSLPSVGQTISAAIDPLDALQAAMPSFVKSWLQGMAKAEAQSVASSLNSLIKNVNNSSVPNLNAHWFEIQYAPLLAIALYLAFSFLISRSARATRQGDPVEFGKGLAAFAIFVVSAGFIPSVVNRLTYVCDEVIAPAWLASAGSNIQSVLTNVATEMTKQNHYTEQLLMMVIILFGAVLAAAALALEFFVREAALYLFTIAFLFSYAMVVGGKWEFAKFWRTAAGLVGLIMFKVLAAIILTLAVGMLGHPSGNTNPVIYGGLIIMILPWLTWMAYKWISGHNAQPSAIVMRVWSTSSKLIKS